MPTADAYGDAEVEKFARNGALISGGALAILLQVADPVVGGAVARHSDFANRPLDRLRNTLTFVYAAVLGTSAEGARVASYVERAHRDIPGANDAQRQLWVAATLYGSAITVHEKLYGAIDADLADRILAAYAPLATSLRVPEMLWPLSRSQFDLWFADATAQLLVTDDARGVARDLFHPRVAPPWLRASLPLAELLTASLLSPELRDAFGLPWSRARDRRARAAWATVRVAARLSPQHLREWPSRHYLRQLRERASRAS
ncbi:MAG: oxygenase MpaB family protein [Microbacteriaceae bacterium]